MPGVLNKFFTPRHKGEEEKLPQKIYSKKIKKLQ